MVSTSKNDRIENEQNGQRGEHTFGHISFYDNIQIMYRRLFTGEGKKGARGREMFKMHAYNAIGQRTIQ